MRALGFEPKKEEIKKMIADIDKGNTRPSCVMNISAPLHIERLKSNVAA